MPTRPSRFVAVLTALATLALVALFGTPGCTRSGEEQPALVLVEVSPLVGLVDPLLERSVEIRPIVPVGVSPHAYQLTPATVADLARADLVITVGATLDPAITRAVKAQVPAERLFSIAAELGVDVGDDHDHAHDDHGHHHHAADPHLWLDPDLMSRFVDAIDTELVERGLARADHANYLKTLHAGITSVDVAYRDRLTPFAGRAIITHHDAFSRIADRYGLTVSEVIRPVSTVEPTPGDLARATEAILASKSGVIFVEPQFSDALPRRIADQAGLQLYKLDPLGKEDWFETMFFNLQSLSLGLAVPPPGSVPASTTDEAEPSDDTAPAVESEG